MTKLHQDLASNEDCKDAPETYFLFMDECFDDVGTHRGNNRNVGINFGALTGILIPVGQMALIQAEIYELIMIATNSEILDMQTCCTMLHGSDFMGEYNDQIKLKTFKGIVDIILRNEIQICRVCCPVTDGNKEFYYRLPIGGVTHRPEDVIIGWCWVQLTLMLQETLKNNHIIPVMEDDGQPQQKLNFSGTTMSSHAMLYSYLASSCSVPNNKNMLEVLYAKKGCSMFTALVDCISYLLHVEQKHVAGASVSPFKKELVDIINEIPERQCRNIVHVMQWCGEKSVNES